MQKLGEPMAHVRLMAQMGKAVGVDLAAAHAAGELTQQEWAGMIQSCRGCDWGNQCHDWLDTHQEIDEAPETCPNRAVFARLKTSRFAVTEEE